MESSDGRKTVIKSYRDLIVWQKAMDFAEICYKISADFPAFEIYVLTSQLRRAAISVPSNIAEGNGRESAVEYIRFLNIARGSLKEAETQILLAQRFSYLTEIQVKTALALSEEVGKLLNRLIWSLKNHNS
jgi:four helix bundle protein